MSDLKKIKYIPETISKESQEFLKVFKSDFHHGEYKNPELVKRRRDSHNELLHIFLVVF